MSDPLSHDERELQRRLSPMGAASPRRSDEAFAAAVLMAMQERQRRRWSPHASLGLSFGAAACAAVLWVVSGASLSRGAWSDDAEPALTSSLTTQAVLEHATPETGELTEFDEEEEWFAAWEDESLDVESLDDEELLALATALEHALAL